MPTLPAQPRRRGRGPFLVALIAGAGVAAALLALAVFESGSDVAPQQQSVASAASKERQEVAHALIDGTAKHIAAASRGERQQPLVQAPAGAEAEPQTPAPSARPPSGYAFTAAAGEMTRLPLTESLPVAHSADALPDWLDERQALVTVAESAAMAGRSWAFGWLRLAENADMDELSAAASPFGVDIVGSAGAFARARLPGNEERLRSVAALPAVDGLGMVPPERKAAADFVAGVHDAPHRQVPVFITLMANDIDGRWKRSLQGLGAVVGAFDADIRAYTANVDASALAATLQADFVLAVEPVGIVRATHDTAVPAMGVDALREHDGFAGLFSGVGGASVPVGVMDTGLNTNHLDIASNRTSICGANFIAMDSRAEDADLWVDEDGHGTHVTGTIVGNGIVEPRYAGMAPAVAHIRFAKVLSRDGSGAAEGIIRGMDFLAQPSSCASVAPAVKPLVVNMSLSATGLQFEGREADIRKLDAVVWAHRQLYVVAQSNGDIHGFSNFAAAKNSLPVGAIADDGDLAIFSSYGPTADDRLAPLVVATGVDLYSAAGNGSRGAYESLSGTSMASPSVAGLAALLMDAVPSYKEQPALVRARLMASAIRPAPWLQAAEAFPRTNSAGSGRLQAQFGLGKVSARTSILARDRADGWVSGGAVSRPSNGEYGYHEVVVPDGASRLDIAMTWDEPPADTIGNVVLNNLDLYADRGGDCGGAACGEYASTSAKDNVEWIIVDDPPPGTYRLKVVPRRLYTAAPHVGLAWTVVRGSTSPNLRLAVDRTHLVGTGPHQLSLTASATAYVAAGTRLHVACRNADDENCSDIDVTAAFANEDGAEISSQLSTSDAAAGSVGLGEIGAGERQTIRLTIVGGEGSRLYFWATGWNARAATTSVAIAAAGDEAVAAAEAPANDDFASAQRLAGQRGERDFDLLLATTEPGEPELSWQPRIRGRPNGSIWYRWTATEDGLARFTVAGSTAEVQVDVYRGAAIAALEPLAVRPGGVSFFAEKDTAYRIRLSYRGPLPAAATLHYSSGPRPANDDFAAAIALTGAAGTITGNNQGATLEQGEQVGELAATVWYRWRAATDGSQYFATGGTGSADFGGADPNRLLVFAGDGWTSLRLVGGGTGTDATVPVRTGEDYWIVVAATGALDAAGHFELEWRSEDGETENDDFADAATIEGTTGAESVRTGQSVEPGEPAHTGVKTRWWVWTAPYNGIFTWRLTDVGDAPLRLSVFASTDADPSFADLTFAGASSASMTTAELSLNAREGRRYWLAIGYPSGDLAAFSGWEGSATLEWGEAPANDTFANAAALPGASGTVAVANRYATIEGGERTGRLGHGSLWWRLGAETSGWKRFWIEGEAFTLAVYRLGGSGGDGVAGLELVASSDLGWLEEAPMVVEVLFNASGGERYVVRLGLRGDTPAEESNLQWETTPAPSWLRYLGRLVVAERGDDMSVGGSLALDDLGTTLYLSDEDGLHVFSRSATTAALAPERRIELPLVSELVWDDRRELLYALACGEWRQFAPTAGSRRRLDGRVLTGSAAETANCADDAFLDASGSFLYVVRESGLDVVAIETSASAVELAAVQDFQISVKSARLAPDGEHIYAVADADLFVLARDGQSGRLTETSRVEVPSQAETLAISDDGNLLFAFSFNATSDLFELQDGAAPALLHTLPAFGASLWSSHERCRFAAARNGRAAADLFCRDLSLVVTAGTEEDEAEEGGATTLRPADLIGYRQPDRFNNHVPKFNPDDLAISPDGRHAYVYANGEILIFERVGNQAGDDAGATAAALLSGAARSRR